MLSVTGAKAIWEVSPPDHKSAGVAGPNSPESPLCSLFPPVEMFQFCEYNENGNNPEKKKVIKTLNKTVEKKNILFFTIIYFIHKNK
jgi:hypothetical protein